MSGLMWTYQTHFCGAQQAAARRVFRELDPRFDPQLFLVGFLAKPSQERPLVCVEPAEDFWLTTDEFRKVELVHKHGFACLASDAKPGETSTGLQTELQLRKTIRDTVSTVIAHYAGFPAELQYSVSIPARVERYWVCAALGLQTDVLRSIVALKSSEARAHGRRSRVATSLVDAALIEFLDLTALELARPQPGRELSQIDPDETLRAAGRRLMRGVIRRIDDSRIDGLPDLFRAFTSVSSLSYERKAGAGSVFIARHGHPALTSTLAFSASARVGHHGHARKLLELTSTDIALHTDADRIFGLVEVDRDRLAGEDIFEVSIAGQHHWELLHDGRPLMRVQSGQPSIPKTRIDVHKLIVDLRRIFDGITDDDCERLVSLVEAAVEESSGTMLVITAAAAEEALRLAAQGIPVQPRDMSPDLLRHVTPIDGAVLLSPDGRCHAIGTILDGIATSQGDPSRGARYNSAVRYVGSTTASCLAVVVSEDGRVDYVPDLRPPIRRIDLESRIDALARVQSSGKVNRRAFYESLGWFEAHRFYLLAEHCDRLNTLVAALEAHLNATDPRSSTRLHEPFTPHPEMNPALFYTVERQEPTATVHV
jgi:hypothetical protein